MASPSEAVAQQVEGNRMAAIESKLAEALTEIKNLREALTKEVEERRRDHDELIKLKEWAKTLFKRIESLEGMDGRIEQELKTLRPLLDKVKELEEWRETEEKAAKHKSEAEKKKAEDEAAAEKKKSEDASKEKSKRAWQIWMAIFGAILSIIGSGIIGGWIAKHWFKP